VFSQIKNLIKPRDGRHVHFGGLGARYVVSAQQTGGAFALIEHDLAPRALGAPMHTHEREDEISHVTSGRLGVQIGDDVIEAGPGDTVVKPRGIPHAFWNPGDKPVQFLELITPPGFEHYFAELEPILGPGGPPDFEALMAVQARYALSMDMDSMPRLIAEHGLNAPPAGP
jgi:quercetin dioxygenase-like cupin family protein